MFSRILNLQKLNFFHEICCLFRYVLNRLLFKNKNSIKLTVIFYQKYNVFSKFTITNRKSGFVKTCDEHVHRVAACWTVWTVRGVS